MRTALQRENSSLICLPPTTEPCGQLSSRCGGRQSWRWCGCCRHRVLATAGSVAYWLLTGCGRRSDITSRSSRASIRRRGYLRRCLFCRRRFSSGSVSSGANCYSHRAGQRGPRLHGPWSRMRSSIRRSTQCSTPAWCESRPSVFRARRPSSRAVCSCWLTRLRILAIVPVIWSAISGSAAFLLGVSADYALPLTGIALAVFELQQSETSPSGPAPTSGQPAAR